jgi:mycofactocin biosynthetic radical S-adenosylmethionine protein MftC
VSTDAIPEVSTAFDLDLPWRLDERAAIRPEPFGAMLHHFGTRKLSFLKSTTLLSVLRSLAEQPTARAACTAAGVTEAELASYVRALTTLASSNMIVPGGPPTDRCTAQPASRRHTNGHDANRQTDMFELGLTSPICLTWELTYACNLACVHCLSSSGRRDPRELTTAECQAVIDTLRRMQVFYVNIGGGEPTVRADFWELLDYSTAHRVGVKFSTNGIKLDASAARRLAASDYVDVQISLDGATAEVNDAVRGAGSYETARRAMAHLAAAGFRGFKVSVVITRHNISQLDAFKEIADDHGAQLRRDSPGRVGGGDASAAAAGERRAGRGQEHRPRRGGHAAHHVCRLRLRARARLARCPAAALFGPGSRRGRPAHHPG